MKLFKKVMTLVAIMFALFAMAGCDALFGGKNGLELDGPDSPTITNASEYSFSLHYGDSKTLSVTAEATDGGNISYQWYKGTSDKEEKATAISGATNNTFTIIAPEYEVPKTYYWCKVTNTKNGKTADGWTYAYDVTVTNIIEIEAGDIEDNEWNADYTYYIKSWANINHELKIPAGTTIKLGNQASLATIYDGYLLAEGTDAKPVVFTSYRDNSVGITITEVENATKGPQAGDWKYVEIGGTSGSELKNCIFRYGGYEYGYALNVTKQSMIDSCIFTNNKSVNTKGALNVDVEQEFAENTTVTNSKFFDNEWPLSCNTYFTVDTSNVFHKPNPEDPEDVSVKNKYQAITMFGSGDIGSEESNSITVSWNVTELAYYYVENNGWINVYGTLNIGDGVVVKFNNDSELAICETADFNMDDAILTSRYDHDHKGNIDGSSRKAKAGDWKGLIINGTLDNDINNDTTKVLYN